MQSVGDVLDCEIGAVKKLNSSLISAYPGTSMRVGVEAFSVAQAQLADLDCDGAPFATPGYTGGEAQPRIITAATSIQRGQILRYNTKPGWATTGYHVRPGRGQGPEFADAPRRRVRSGCSCSRTARRR